MSDLCGAPHPTMTGYSCETPAKDGHADHFCWSHIGSSREAHSWPNTEFKGAVPVPGRKHARIPNARERNAILERVKLRGDAPPTSVAAAAAALPAAGTKRRAVLDAIIERPSTDEEIGELLGIPGNTVRPRRIELVELGLIEDSGLVRPTAQGNAAIIWRAVP